MGKKKYFPLFFVYCGIVALPVCAVEDEGWISPSFETAVYSPYGMSYGAGFALAYGRGVSIGLKAAYFINGEKAADVLELTCLFRLYMLNLRGGGAIYGPWFQFNGGPALYIRENITDSGHEWGDVSAGLTFGWRFLLGKLLYIEPYIKGGYPFLFGGGLATGVHF